MGVILSLSNSKHNGSAWRFLKQFISRPSEVGALAPCSKHLALAVTKAAGAPDADIVVEFGAGTGSITAVLAQLLRKDASFLSVEINPEFVEICRKRFPDIEIIEGSAENTLDYLKEHGHSSCHSIVSGLPWAVFNEELQDRLLDAVMESLAPGGKFATYTYITSLFMPSGKRFLKKLKSHFPTVKQTPICWRNFPPALVYYVTKED